MAVEIVEANLAPVVPGGGSDSGAFLGIAGHNAVLPDMPAPRRLESGLLQEKVCILVVDAIVGGAIVEADGGETSGSKYDVIFLELEQKQVVCCWRAAKLETGLSGACRGRILTLSW